MLTYEVTNNGIMTLSKVRQFMVYQINYNSISYQIGSDQIRLYGSDWIGLDQNWIGLDCCHI